MADENNKKAKALLAGIAVCFCLLAAFEVWKIYNAAESMLEENIHSLISTAVGSAMFLFVIVYCSYSHVLKINIKALPRHIAFLLPCLLVAINNFPIIPFFSGKAYISGKGSEIFVYFLACLGTGLFEELVFRGYVFIVILEKCKRDTRGLFTAVIASSAIFGLTHLVNIFAGAGSLATVLQVGYSFLVGAMCSIALLKTGSVWYPVLLHSVYNFAGGVVPRFGGGTVWDVPTVTVTVILAIFAAMYLIFALMRADAEIVNKKKTK